MPLLAKRIFSCVKPLTDVKPDDTIFTIPHTKEQFRSKEEYEKRIHLYKSRIWTCQSTGHVNLTHEEAWNSEKAVVKTLKAGFAPCYDKPVLELVHHSSLALESVVDQAWMLLQQVLSVDERVVLKVKTGSGKSLKAIVVKVDRAGVTSNPTSNCSSPSSDKENADREENSANKKWVPPKLLPYRYSIRLEGEDSVIHSVPAADLGRCDKPPSKELLRLFIRTYAVRAGQTSSSPWIVDEVQVRRYDLPNKFTSFLLSPVKWKPEEMLKKIDEESRNMSASKNSPRIKTKTDAQELKRKKAAKESLSKLKVKSPKKNESHKTVVVVSDSDTTSDSDNEGSSSDSDVPLSIVKIQLTPKKNNESKTSTPSSAKSLTPKSKSSDSSGSKKSGLLKKSGSDKKTLSKEKKLKKEKLDKKKKQKDKDKKKKKIEKIKKKDKTGLKQLTLFDLSKKGSKIPEKKSKSPEKKVKTPSKGQKTPEKRKKSLSPAKTPAIIQKLQQALAKNNKKGINVYSRQAAAILNSQQRARLPSNVKDIVLNKYNKQQERRKLAMMSEAEKKEYMKKKALERKQKEKKSSSVQEDTELTLTPLPAPNPVATPDNMPNETFGDVVMVTEFISCFSGLLMPGDEFPVYTDTLMKALSDGKDGFVYLSRVVTILLQTLLQDEIAEDYQELNVPLSDIPVNSCTASELVRLCLRKQDVSDDRSDSSDNSVQEEEEDEVPDDLIQQLETTELYQLDPVQKLTILKGLCLRIMGTYSVQDFMAERQNDTTKLMKQYKAVQAKAEKAGKGKESETSSTEAGKSENAKAVEDDKQGLLTSFYGKKAEDKAPSSGNSSEVPMETEETDVPTVGKRRRITAAQAAEEKIKREREERLRRAREHELYKKEREREILEDKLTAAMNQARMTLRQAPIGCDRNHTRYWIFSDVTPGLCMEKGWVSDDIEYQVQGTSQRGDNSSSSDDDDDEQDTAVSKKSSKTKNAQDRTFPHVSQNLWFTYDTMEEVNALLKSLHPKGVRERVLKTELMKRYNDLKKAVTKVRKVNKEIEDRDGDVEMIGRMKKELLETEMRLRNGGLGGVMDFQTWEKMLETATDVTTLAECMLDTQNNVLEKFRDGIMGPNRKKVKSPVKEESKESGDEEEKEEEVTDSTSEWREAVKNCPTFSRLHVLLGILDSCIKWEKSAEHAKCKICRKKGDDDRLLLCDDCNQAFHMYCLRPALSEVPKGDWHCPACAPQYRKRVRDVPGKYREYNIGQDGDDEDEAEEAIEHEENCVECGGDEDLIHCDTCPSVYHLECHDPPLRGRWVCNNCKNGTKRKTRSGGNNAAVRAGNRGTKRKKKEESSSEDESSGEEEEDSEEEKQSKDTDYEVTDAPARQPKKRAKTSQTKQGRRPRKAQAVQDVYETFPKTNRRAPSELSMAEDVINQMLQYKNAWPFHAAVSKRDVPDYYDIIKQPIDFQRIKDKLNCLVYGSPQEVIDDVALLFRNAAEYNKFGSDVYECMEQSEKYFVELMKKHLPLYAYSRDHKPNGYGDHMYTQGGRKARRSK